MPFLTSTNPVVTISGSDPVVSTGGPTPVISIQDATVEQKGAVQLEDSVSSNSVIKAATPKNVKEIHDYTTTISGSLQADIDNKLENIVEDITPQLGGDLDGGGYNFDNVGKLCSVSSSVNVCNDTGSTITKGTAVTICDLSGETCCVCVADNREAIKMPACGILNETITTGNFGCMVVLGRVCMDTLGFTGNVGDRLYVQSDGFIDTTIPTSGSVQRVGFLTKKASGAAGRVCVCTRGRRSIYAAKDEHPTMRMGDDVGHRKVCFLDYNNNEVGCIDSDGNLTVSGTVDTVSLAAFKSDYDNHNHDDRYYTESETDTISGTLQSQLDTLDTNKLEEGTEIKIKVYSQDDEPTLGADQKLAMWIDTNDANRVRMIFRRGVGDQTSVELT